MSETPQNQSEKSDASAPPASPKQFGDEIGIVTKFKDPDQHGRVKVCFPRLPGKPESDWCRVVQPAAGAGRGFYWVPHVSGEGLIPFERGEAHRPYVIGSRLHGEGTPPPSADTPENTAAVLPT